MLKILRVASLAILVLAGLSPAAWTDAGEPAAGTEAPRAAPPETPEAVPPETETLRPGDHERLAEAFRRLHEQRARLQTAQTPRRSPQPYLLAPRTLPLIPRPCLAQQRPPGPAPRGEQIDPCRLGEALSRMPPCLDARDCQAAQVWEQLYGAPQVEEVPGSPSPPSVPVPVSSPEPEPEKD